MTIVSLVTIHPNPGVKWDDVQKQIKKACDLARKHGAENVTVLATMIGGAATNTISVLSTAEDWTRYGQAQQAFMDDPETQAAMLEGGQIATWQTYVSQTIPDM
jgi:sugar phosphate isomerase/epimerase